MFLYSTRLSASSKKSRCASVIHRKGDLSIWKCLLFQRYREGYCKGRSCLAQQREQMLTQPSCPDYTNPLTRFAMRDYPHDNGPGMSQIHNGQKMLLDLPQHVTTPTVRVDDWIYFVGELLQRKSGAYFIPERFFTRNTGGQGPGQQQELFSLGRSAVRSSVSGFCHRHKFCLMSSQGGICCK